MSITLEADCCIEAVEEALPATATSFYMVLRRPVETAQFTSTEFIKVMDALEVKTSMDGKGAWQDNVFVERLWRTIKYEQVYMRAYASVSEARASIRRSIGFYNTRRPHSSLAGNTPDQAHFSLLLPVPVAA